LFQAQRSRGGVISKAVAVATAQALIKRHPELNLNHINIEESSWAKSLFKRMGFRRRLATTGKVSIPEELKKEIEESYLYSIVKKIEENQIPLSLVINLDQTPTKFVPGCNKTMAEKGSKTVSIAGSTDKRMITATFAITLSGDFLPIQLIYGGKTSKSIPAVAFPPEFLLSANEKHYSNEKESLNMLEKIIIPFVEKERRSLDLHICYPALLIMDVFKGQMTELVQDVLRENNIFLVKVPANLTYLFQPLDVQGGPNGYVKRMMKNKFTLWYADQITRALDDGNELNNINVSMKLSVVKPLHAKWIIEMYDHMTSTAGKAVCLKAWEVTGISAAVKKGLGELANIDPFNDIDPLLACDSFENEDRLENSLERDMYIHENNLDSDSDYEDDVGNIFSILEDDMADS
jgi:hypothetical protein